VVALEEIAIVGVGGSLRIKFFSALVHARFIDIAEGYDVVAGAFVSAEMGLGDAAAADQAYRGIVALGVEGFVGELGGAGGFGGGDFGDAVVRFLCHWSCLEIACVESNCVR